MKEEEEEEKEVKQEVTTRSACDLASVKWPPFRQVTASAVHTARVLVVAF